MSAKLSKKHSIKEYRLFIEAWFFLAVARILIFWIPFRKLLPLIGQQVSQGEAKLAGLDTPASSVLLEEIRTAIMRACRRSPWRTLCFEQALTARLMLRNRRLKSIIYFGVCKEPSLPTEKLLAHAWLICSGTTVTGGKNNQLFTIVGCFMV
jgi:hypothetical protein